MTKETKDILVNLVIDRVRSSTEYNKTLKEKPTDYAFNALTERDYQELRRYLTHVLCNPATLKHHKETLVKLNYQSPKTDIAGIVEWIVANGIEKVPEQTLVKLALDTEALAVIQGTIEKSKSPAWKKALRAEMAS